MRRRIAIHLLALGAAATMIAGCEDTGTKHERGTTMTATNPAPLEALHAVGLPEPDAPLSLSEGIRVSDLDEWSVQIRFEGEAATVDAWLAEAFGDAHGLTVSADGEPISQRLAPEDVHQGARFIDGSNPADPAAVYTVLISPEGTAVTVAAARTSR